MSGAGSPLPFDEFDPFNPNRVRGFIVRSRRRRGDLQITHVNGEACAQYVHATPKIPQLEPATELRAFERAHVFDKLDGTNVLLFRYRDARGREFVSYKTRASPFLRLQPYGDFVALWRQILERYAGPLAELAAAPHHFGFELFGREVRILTEYPVALDARLLYAIDRDSGRVLAPAAVAARAFPMPARLGEYGAAATAATLHAEVLAQCRATPTMEGAVVYLATAGEATPYKIKPPSVLERQARYRELYEVGKTLRSAGRERAAVLEGVSAHVEGRWSPELQDAQRGVIEIVQQDLGKELDFDGALAPKQAARPSPIDDDAQILWRTVWGSHVWGMNTATSDQDRCVVYKVSSRLLACAVDNPALFDPHRAGWHGRTATGDEHQYELGRAVALLLGGSMTLLFGVMSPLVLDAHGAALAQLRQLVEDAPSKVFLGAVLRDLADSERMMARAREEQIYLKHLRIGCRNLRFAITLFTHGRYEFLPSTATQRAELEALRAELSDSYEASPLPAHFDRRPFDDYLARWR
jgi:RNA repair pathway DNA polymerase beta family